MIPGILETLARAKSIRSKFMYLMTMELGLKHGFFSEDL